MFPARVDSHLCFPCFSLAVLGLHGLCLEDARMRISLAHVSPSLGHGFVILQFSFFQNVSQADSPNLLKEFFFKKFNL